MPLKKSSEYRTIRPRVTSPTAADSWQEEGLHFFVFELKPVDAIVNGADPPVAVFTMHPEEPAPISVVVVTPKDNGEAEVIDLRRPEHAYTTAFPATVQHDVTPADSSDQVVAGVPTAESGQEQQFDEHVDPSAVLVGATIAAGSATFNEPANDLLANPNHASNASEAVQIVEQGAIMNQDRLSMAAQPDYQASISYDQLLVRLKHSLEYQVIRDRLGSFEPVDAWQEEDLHFFVFQLRAVDSLFANPSEPAVAVFTMHPQRGDMVSAVIVTPQHDGAEPDVRNVLVYEAGSTVEA